MRNCGTCGQLVVKNPRANDSSAVTMYIGPHAHKDTGEPCPGGIWKAYEGELHNKWNYCQPVWTPVTK